MGGMDIKTLADRAGHADPILTTRQSIHAFDAQRTKAAIPLETRVWGDVRVMVGTVGSVRDHRLVCSGVPGTSRQARSCSGRYLVRTAR